MTFFQSIYIQKLGGMLRWALVISAALSALGLSGCDQLGIETPQKAAERQEADAKAVGSACRHALRAIEDCYTLNPKAEKSAVFAGWREMDEYMRENKLEGTKPLVAHGAASKPADSASQAEEDEPPAKGKGDKAEKSEKSDKAAKGKGGN